jgi:hypothetical protein
MQARQTLSPGQKGTKKFLERYGKQLICVRYRYDDQRRKRFTTIEIIVEESTGLRLKSRRLSDCEWNSGKPNCSAVSNSLAANGIPQNGSGKFTMTRRWRLVSRSG